MTTDDTRLASLQKGASAAGTSLYITIQTKDLRWLIEQAESIKGPPVNRNSKPDTQGAK